MREVKAPIARLGEACGIRLNGKRRTGRNTATSARDLSMPKVACPRGITADELHRDPKGYEIRADAIGERLAARLRP